MAWENLARHSLGFSVLAPRECLARFSQAFSLEDALVDQLGVGVPVESPALDSRNLELCLLPPREIDFALVEVNGVRFTSGRILPDNADDFGAVINPTGIAFVAGPRAVLFWPVP